MKTNLKIDKWITILNEISRHDVIKMSEIARITKTTVSHTIKTLKELESLQLIKKKEVGRYNEITLTQKGIDFTKLTLKIEYALQNENKKDKIIR